MAPHNLLRHLPGFTVYAFGRYSGYLDETCKPDTLFGQVLVYLDLMLLPLDAFPVPYTSAMVLRSIGGEPRVWVKTPSTEESQTAS